MASSHFYGKAIKNLAAGNWAWNSSHNIVLALMNGQYLPDESTEELWSDISEYEVEGINYSRTTLTIIEPTYFSSAREIWLDSSTNVLLELATLSARYAVIFIESGDPLTEYLVGWIDFGENRIAQENDFAINWTENGIFRLRRS